MRATWPATSTIVASTRGGSIFSVDDVVEREPHEGAEHPSRRAYVTAHA
jgi:hypothetical protein